MLTFVFNQEAWDYSVREIRKKPDFRDSTNFEPEFNRGGLEENIRSFYCEVLLADYLGLPRPKGGSKLGFDLLAWNFRIDVKSQNNDYEVQAHYDSAVKALQIRNKTDLYAFAFFNQQTRVVTFSGWTTKARLVDKGKKQNYMIPVLRKEKSWFVPPSDCYQMEVRDQNSMRCLEAFCRTFTVADLETLGILSWSR